MAEAVCMAVGAMVTGSIGGLDPEEELRMTWRLPNAGAVHRTHGRVNLTEGKIVSGGLGTAVTAVSPVGDGAAAVGRLEEESLYGGTGASSFSSSDGFCAIVVTLEDLQSIAFATAAIR